MAIEQGLKDMRGVIRAGFKAAAGALVAIACAVAPASAQELSDTSVQVLMDYAWSLTPERFTNKDGVTIEVDRNNRKAVELPLETAREVIKAGRLTAHAATCDLKEEIYANHRVFMAKKTAEKKWTPQQMLYMNQLHLVTVMLLTGKLQVVEKEDGKQPKIIQDGDKTDVTPKSCTDEQKTKIREAVGAFVKANANLIGKAPPDFPSGPTAPATPAAAAPSKK